MYWQDKKRIFSNVHGQRKKNSSRIVVAVSFLKGRNESRERQTGWTSFYDRWQHYLSPPPQFRHGTGGDGNILQTPAPVVSAATTHKTFGPTELTSTYSVCTLRVFGGIGHQTQAFQPGV
ncbi:uncharacterized protein TNCV_153921 [Trichonephila clavipes]|nr:uncharacterized protein TNCV_153921 [Trichonephila clavipes]